MRPEPWRPTGTVYGVLMNKPSEWEALAAAMHAPPYGKPPQAPVLHIKTGNTFSADGAAIAVPAHAPEVEVGATVGLVMRSATEVAGCVLLNDLSLPHENYFRPPVKLRCLDGFLGVGPRVVPLAEVGELAALELAVRINGTSVQTVRFDALHRPLPRLLADVAGFMTLQPGDVLMPGCEAQRPRARAGDVIEIACPALGLLTNTLVRAEVPA